MFRTTAIHFQHLSDISSFKEFSVQALLQCCFCYIFRRSPEALHKPPPGQAYGGLYSIQYVLQYFNIIVVTAGVTKYVAVYENTGNSYLADSTYIQKLKR